MNYDRWEKIKSWVEYALDLPIKERESWLRNQCQDDLELFQEAWSLIEHSESAPAEFDRSAELRESINDPSPSTLPEAIGPYKVIRQIGSGGIGTVFEAHQEAPNRRVALKTLSLNFPSEEAIRRFRKEAELLGRLQHRGITQIFDAGIIDEERGVFPYLVMELIDGKPLTEYVWESCHEIRERIALFIEICSAVEHAHQHGIIHRDLKPENILITPEGKPKILDFGVARSVDNNFEDSLLQTQVGQLVGTIPYMSPEQVVGDLNNLDVRSDVYTLGVLLYEALSHRLPYDLLNCSVPEATRIIRDEDPDQLSTIDSNLAGDLNVIVMKALEKLPDRRYPTAQALANDLERFLRDKPISARPPSTFYQFKKFSRRNKGLVGGVIATLLVSIIGIIISLSFAIESKQNERLAVKNADIAQKIASHSKITTAFAFIDTSPIASSLYLSGIPLEHRDWEWSYLWSRLEPYSKFNLDHSDPSDKASSRAFTFHSDGKFIFASTSGNTVYLRRSTDFESETELEYPDEVSEVYFSEDGSRLVSLAGASGLITVWDTSTQQGLSSFKSRPGSKFPRFSGDGNRVAVTHSDGGVQVFESTTGRLVLNIEPWGVVHSLCTQVPKLNHNGSVVALTRVDSKHSGGTRFPLKLFHAESQSPRIVMLGEKTLDVHFESSVAAVVSGDDIQVVNFESKEVIAHLQGHDFKPLTASFSQDGQFLTSSTIDEIRVWNLQSQRSIKVIKSENPIPRLSPERDQVASLASGEVHAWNLSDSSSRVLKGHKRWVYSVTMSPDGSMIASGDFDGSLNIWDSYSGQLLQRESQLPGGVRGLFFTKNNRSLVITVASSPNPSQSVMVTVLYDLLSGEWETIHRSGNEIYGGFPESELWLEAPFRSKVGHRRENWTTDHDGSHFYMARRHRVFHIPISQVKRYMQKETKYEEEKNGFRLARTGVPAIAVSPDGKSIVTGHPSKDLEGLGVLMLWDAKTRKKIKEVGAHRGEIYSIHFSPDGKRIVTGGNDNAVGVFDAESLIQVAELRGHKGYVRSVVFSPDGTQIISGSGDGTVRVWDSKPAYYRQQQVEKMKSYRKEMDLQMGPLYSKLGSLKAVREELISRPIPDSLYRVAVLRSLMSYHSSTLQSPSNTDP